MSHYRLFSINESDHVAGPPKTFECDDDEAAIEKATTLLEGKDAELWEGARLVIRFNAQAASPTFKSS